MSMKSSSTNPFILGLIIMLGVIAGYVYHSQAGGDASYDIPLPASAQDTVFLKFKDLRLDFSVLQKEPFTDLNAIGEFPIQPGATGKEDPFAPL